MQKGVTMVMQVAGLSLADGVLLCAICFTALSFRVYDVATNLTTWLGGSSGDPSVLPAGYPYPPKGSAGGAVIAYGMGVVGGGAWIDWAGGLWYGYGSSTNFMCNGECTTRIFDSVPRGCLSHSC
jgi:hypothetical protein